MHIFIKFVKGSVWKPGLVKVQRSNSAVQQLAQRFHVVDDSVVGALCNGQDPRFAVGMFRLCLASERVRLNLLLNVFGIKFFHRNWADDA